MISMRPDDLRELQQPLKQAYRDDAAAAQVTLRASGDLSDGVACSVQTGHALVEAGLHPATGGTGTLACSGDMLLQALVACAGVTLQAVATSLDLPVRGGQIAASASWDARGTLAVDRDAPVGLQDIHLDVTIDGDLSDEQQATLLKLTERYCVVLQTLRGSPTVTASMTSTTASD
jgi:uncharacterized OsmC-like protein